jgi:hypothetical protein
VLTLQHVEELLAKFVIVYVDGGCALHHPTTCMLLFVAVLGGFTCASLPFGTGGRHSGRRVLPWRQHCCKGVDHGCANHSSILYAPGKGRLLQPQLHNTMLLQPSCCQFIRQVPPLFSLSLSLLLNIPPSFPLPNVLDPRMMSTYRHSTTGTTRHCVALFRLQARPRQCPSHSATVPSTAIVSHTNVPKRLRQGHTTSMLLGSQPTASPCSSLYDGEAPIHQSACLCVLHSHSVTGIRMHHHCPAISVTQLGRLTGRKLASGRLTRRSPPNHGMTHGLRALQTCMISRQRSSPIKPG